MSAVPAARRTAAPDAGPGRTCPVSYRYAPRVFDRAPEIACETLYVVGGLYGNVEALETVLAMAAREPGPVTLAFNGDFHWFDVDAGDFARVTGEVLRHWALRGNVETEVAAEDSGAGCGCAYPADVSDAEVSRSNAILGRLRETARGLPGLRERLAALPMHLTARVGEARVAIVHGDAASLAGWGFARDRLDDPAHERWLRSVFGQACVDVFACTHTCVPALRAYAWEGVPGVVVNNGAAGMPNFEGACHGLLTRIARAPYGGGERVYGVEVAGAHVEALRIDYDHGRWIERFLASWPAGSPAHDTYFRRISEGPRFSPASAAPQA